MISLKVYGVLKNRSRGNSITDHFCEYFSKKHINVQEYMESTCFFDDKSVKILLIFIKKAPYTFLKQIKKITSYKKRVSF